jgi:hypothetical protein
VRAYTAEPMETSVRRAAVAVALVVVMAGLSACGTQADPRTRALPTPVPTFAADPERDAYEVAMCPLLMAVLDLDPRLAALRDAGTAGDVDPVDGELAAVAASILGILDGLEAVPDWTPGSELRFNLITSLHAIRTSIVSASEQPGTAASEELLADLPFLATEAMDRSMQRAVEGGLDCQGIG